MPMIERIRIKLSAYDHRLLDQCSRKISEAVKLSGARISGPIPLPTKRKVFCVIRSPNIDKESMEHFERVTHKRLIDIYEPTPETIRALESLDIPSGVYVEIK